MLLFTIDSALFFLY